MPSLKPKILNTWDYVNTSHSAHSRLYKIKPEGLHTADCESLNSYIIRLSHAHCISIRQLFFSEYTKHLKKEYLSKGSFFFTEGGLSINGSNSYAASFSEATEKLTHQSDLQYLTMLTWQNITSKMGHGLLKTKRKWCPKCYQDQKKDSKPHYEKLLWSIEGVEICPKHKIMLHGECPKCGKEQLALYKNLGIGFCHHCDTWLGVINENDHSQLLDLRHKDYEWYIWYAEAVGEMIANAKNLRESLIIDILAIRIKLYCDTFFDGDTVKFSDSIPGIGYTTISQWKRGRYLPMFNSFIYLCSKLGVKPVKFLCGELPKKLVPLLSSKPTALRRSNRKLVGKVSISDMENKLYKIFYNINNDPLSVAAVARRLHCNVNVLKLSFPDECKAISDHYNKLVAFNKKEKIKLRKQQIKLVVYRLYNQGLYPSQNRVGALLPSNGYFRDPILREAYIEARQDIGL